MERLQQNNADVEHGKLSRVGRSFRPSPIQELSQFAQKHDAVNLAEGFPDFPASPPIKSAAISAINSDFNQYRHVQGICNLLASRMKSTHGLQIDPLTDIAICCGQTEAFAAAVFAVVDFGDEVILFDPSYETYDCCIRMAGGIPVFVELEPPNWRLNPEKFLQAFTPKTKAVVLNSPQNPTGKVFGKEELAIIAEACREHDCLAITDEVYEHITFDNVPHITIASLPEMQQRTIITSSMSKTFGVTGWRIGWAIGPSQIASAIRNIHVKLTDSAPAPFQEAAVFALKSPPQFYDSLRRDYEGKRDILVGLVVRIGLKVHFAPKGSFFVFAEVPEEWGLTDVEFVRKMVEEAGVVAVPGSGFFHWELYRNKQLGDHFGYQKRYIRFAFCKSEETLTSAATKLESFHFLLNVRI